MSESYVEVKLNKSALNELNKKPGDILRDLAQAVLTTSYPTIPLSNRVNSGRLRMGANAYGVVKHSSNDYSIGVKNVPYANYVWVMDDSKTNWTTSGTHSYWYLRTTKEKGKTLLSNVVNREKLK